MGDGPTSPRSTEERPGWWEDAIAEFEAHDLRPYRPPRFADGALKQPVVDRLEHDHGVDITVVCFDPEPNDDWQVRVDGEPVATVGHRRHRAGYSVFEVTAAEFESLVRTHLTA